MTVDVTRLSNGLTVASDQINGVESTALGVWVGTELEPNLRQPMVWHIC